MDCRENTVGITENPHQHAAHYFDLDSVLTHLAHWLPTQGPIKDFIHHNTLHAVQNLPFHDGIALASKMFGARSYLALENYQAMYEQGRITDAALSWAIARNELADSEQAGFKKALFKAAPNSHFPPASLANQGIRTVWLSHIEVDLNSMVQPILFRLLSNFLDQGISRWILPKKGEQFWDCIVRLSNNSFLPLYPLNEKRVSNLLTLTPDEVIKHCLEKIVGDAALYEQYLLELLLAHPGWSGMVRMIEQNPNALLSRREISLKDMLALELTLELAFLYKKRGGHFMNIAQVPRKEGTPLLTHGHLTTKIPLILKTWHEAMEWALHSELLSALQVSANAHKTPVTAQAIFCIDDRECSIRRHLESVNPHIETFGAAGFFGIDFLYQGMADAYPVAQCPNIIVPKHLIKEVAENPKPELKPKSQAIKNMHFSPHTLFRGWIYTQTLGISYAARMAWNVFRPGSTLPNIRKLSEVDSHSHLHLLRESDEPNAEGYLLGFSYPEMADRVGGLLRNIGLTQDFAPTVVIVAHGSSSVNNPHFAAYDCGACSGKPGAPNARAFAWMANSPEVRNILRERGIDIPASTTFVPALHNTSRDEISYFDPKAMSEAATTSFDSFQRAMQQALSYNAQERCRWFELSPKTGNPEDAHQHVKTRTSSIFEPRPELNHSNNLYCIVGRRSLSRDLFLDRRAFLHSYDPNSDKSGEIMVRILSAIIPVCGGINLEYLFSRVDNSVYGAGTKLPHNVIGLLGVANGVEGDLRTGLPSQMIEVHEPSRLLIVIEQDRHIIDQAIAKIGPLKEWLDNEWVRVVSCEPETHALWLYNATGWQSVHLSPDYQVPKATNSQDIIKGKSKTIPVHQLVRSPA